MQKRMTQAGALDQRDVAANEFAPAGRQARLLQLRVFGLMEAMTGHTARSEFAFAGVTAAVAGTTGCDTGQHDVSTGLGLFCLVMAVAALLRVMLLVTEMSSRHPGVGDTYRVDVPGLGAIAFAGRFDGVAFAAGRIGEHLGGRHLGVTRRP